MKKDALDLSMERNKELEDMVASAQLIAKSYKDHAVRYANRVEKLEEVIRTVQNYFTFAGKDFPVWVLREVVEPLDEVMKDV